MAARRAHPNPDVMRLPEAARYLDIGISTLGELVRRGEIPSGLIGRRRYFLRPQLDVWLAAGGTAALRENPRTVPAA
jgi:excisionase family DNA binding protein